MKKLDLDVLQNLRELNTADEPEFVREFFVLFINTAPDRIDAIEKAIKENAPVTLAKEAHALKSSCASIGARDMTELCLQLEQIGKMNTIEGAQQKFLRLKDELAAVRADIMSLPELTAA